MHFIEKFTGRIFLLNKNRKHKFERDSPKLLLSGSSPTKNINVRGSILAKLGTNI